MKHFVLITGGAGFVGTNLAHRYLSEGIPVRLYDNFSRAGVEGNARWLQETHGDLVQVEAADVRDASHLRESVRGATKVFHLAAQVAVTTSLTDPIADFEVNARGTLNVLEAVRACADPPPLVFTSTNKVYGGLTDVALRVRDCRYEPEDQAVRTYGIGETRALDFHSPYGCSKGAADQYVLDYARTYDLPAAVFRMSCIYGPHQFGTEDQGWVAHFLIQAQCGRPITLYGDGMQVRDILYAEDLVNALRLAQDRMSDLLGQAFNIGGGAENSISLLNLLALIRDMGGDAPDIRFEDWRPGDQRYYVSDTRKFGEVTGWTPTVSASNGIGRLGRWLRENRSGSRRERLLEEVAACAIPCELRLSPRRARSRLSKR